MPFFPVAVIYKPTRAKRRGVWKMISHFFTRPLFSIAETGFEPALPTSKSGRPLSLSAFCPRNSRFLACITFLLLPPAAVGAAAPGTRRSQGIKKRYKIFSCISLFDCGDRIWTCDLRVMSPTSYRTALLRGSIKWAEKDSNLRSYRNRFTVCPLWPLGNPPIVV